MASGAELIQQVKSGLELLQPSEAEAELKQRDDVALVDVREQVEYDERYIPGAIHVPRGHLETRIEQFVPDKSKRILLYCSTENRSSLAARTMTEELGYSDVAVISGGITLWKDRGYETVVPRSLTQDQKERYSRHILVPEIGLEGQMKL